GRGRGTAGADTATSPVSTIQATRVGEPMSLADRDEQSVEAPKQKAAPIPPRMASNVSRRACPPADSRSARSLARRGMRGFPSAEGGPRLKRRSGFRSEARGTRPLSAPLSQLLPRRLGGA